MKKVLFSALVMAFVSLSMHASEWTPSEWPVLKHYDQNHLFQVALPLGGIGTGQVSLGGRGELRDWEIMNIPAKGFSTVYTGSSNTPFFAIYVKPDNKEATTTLLEGPIYPHEYVRGGGARKSTIMVCPASRVPRSMQPILSDRSIFRIRNFQSRCASRVSIPSFLATATTAACL